MSTTVFKLTGPPPEGITRRVAWLSRPTWDNLAARIEAIYNIPRDNVGVSYVDNDGDEVTLSSNEELQDYYKFNVKPNEPGNDAIKAIRFLVHDLASQRDTNKPLPQTPRSSNYRNTFGTNGFNNLMFDGDDDWQRVPTFNPAPLFVPFGQEEDEGPHAYVETVVSEATGSKENEENDLPSILTDSIEGEVKADKGKHRASVEEVPDIDDGVSAMSIVEAETPNKMPIHVKQGSQASKPSTEDIFGAYKARAAGSVVPPISVTQPTPKAEKPKVETEVLEAVKQSKSENIEMKIEERTPEIPDPPLPELEDIPTPASNASLANDLATLLTRFSSVLTEHPELSEGLRNIVRNAANGSYWAAHRDAVARAAEEIRRGAEQSAADVRRAAEEAHQAAEEAAGRRVAEALGSVMRTIGQITGSLSASASAAASVVPTPGEPVTSTPARENTWSRRPRPYPRRESQPPWVFPWRFNGMDSFDPHLDVFSSPSGFVHRRAHHGLVPPPGPQSPPLAHGGPVPPPPPAPGPAPPFMPPWATSGAPSPPPPPPPPQSWGIPPVPPFGPHPPFWGWGHGRHGGEFAAPGAEMSFTMPPVSAITVSREPSGSTAETVAESRARLEAAKQAYKAEKERYRKEREARRTADYDRRMNLSGESARSPLAEQKKDEGIQANDKKENAVDGAATGPSITKDATSAATATDPTAPPVKPARLPTADNSVPQMVQVSAARGPFPQLEMLSVPRRHNTMHGTGHRFHPPPMPPPPVLNRPENPFASSPSSRAARNITRRLADMGFTVPKFPNLPMEVDARVRNITRDMPRDAEDTAVQEVLEELLAQSPTAKPAASASAGLHRSQTTGARNVSK